MKAFKFLMVLAVMVSAFNFNAEAQNKKKKGAEEVTFNVHLHCNDCVKKAEAVVPTIKGIKDLKVSLEDQTFWIKYDPSKVTKEALVAALNKKGYDVKEVKAGDKHDHEHNHEHNHGHNHEHGHEHSH